MKKPPRSFFGIPLPTGVAVVRDVNGKGLVSGFVVMAYGEFRKRQGSTRSQRAQRFPFDNANPAALAAALAGAAVWRAKWARETALLAEAGREA